MCEFISSNVLGSGGTREVRWYLQGYLWQPFALCGRGSGVQLLSIPPQGQTTVFLPWLLHGATVAGLLPVRHTQNGLSTNLITFYNINGVLLFLYKDIISVHAGPILILNSTQTGPSTLCAFYKITTSKFILEWVGPNIAYLHKSCSTIVMLYSFLFVCKY